MCLRTADVRMVSHPYQVDCCRRKAALIPGAMNNRLDGGAQHELQGFSLQLAWERLAMAATADIRTGRRSILSYLVSLIDEARLEAGRGDKMTQAMRRRTPSASQKVQL